MNHATHVIGNSASVINRWGNESTAFRPEKLMDVLVFNSSASLLYMQVFNIQENIIPQGTAYSGGAYTLSGLTVGQTYNYSMGANETSFTNGAQTFTKSTLASGSFVATATTAAFTGSGTAAVTAVVFNPNASAAQSTAGSDGRIAPASGATPMFSFPVQPGLGGTLGRSVDMDGIFCAWSTTAATYTAVGGASGSIVIIIKG